MNLTGSYRKRLLLTFALLGSISTMLFITVTSPLFLFGALWAILGNARIDSFLVRVCVCVIGLTASYAGWIRCFFCASQCIPPCSRATPPFADIQIAPTYSGS